MIKHTEAFKKNNMKITPRRQAIIEIFEKSGKYLSSEEVWTFLKKKIKKCGLPGVYRNLESMADCGILFRIVSFEEGRKHYGLCLESSGRHHHHIICIKCRKMSVIEDCAYSDCLKVNGYIIVNHFVQLNGICPDCQKNFK